MNFVSTRLKPDTHSAQSSNPIFKDSSFEQPRITEFGGAEEDRTPDPLLAKQVLSQLSYSPIAVQLHGGPG